MELEEVAAIKNSQTCVNNRTCLRAHLKLYTQVLFALFLPFLLFYFLLTYNHNQVFSGCKLVG